MKESFLEKIKSLADEVALRESCLVYDVEFAGGGGARILRVYIDKDTEAGVSIEDCSNVSKGLNLLLDVEDIIPGGRYSLEVSSPGLERALKKDWHYSKVVGKTVSVKSFAPMLDFNAELPQLGKAKQIKGQLLEKTDSGIKVNVELAGKPAEVYVPFVEIAKANVVFEYGKAQQA